MPGVAYFSHPDYDAHVQGARHPERPDRTMVLNERLKHSDVWDSLQHIVPQEASPEQIELVHVPEYVRKVERFCERGGGLIDGRETGAMRESYRIARLAAGAVTEAVDGVVERRFSSAFCAIRPPGHHALSDRAMGFCLFNNVAIGARHAMERHGMERVLIVDWDFHHGNGTQDTFYRDGAVLFFSVHCSPAYPYSGFVTETGEGAGSGRIVNAPLSPGAGIDQYLEAFRERLIPAARDFQPDLVMISAGFDAHRSDPLSLMSLNTDDFGTFTDLVREIAEEFAGGRIVSVLEGGYNTDSLAASADVHLRHLLA